MIDGLPEGLTDESGGVWIEGTIPVKWSFGKIQLMVRQTEQMMDILMDGQSSRWNHILVHRQMSHPADIQMDLSWY